MSQKNYEKSQTQVVTKADDLSEEKIKKLIEENVEIKEKYSKAEKYAHEYYENLKIFEKKLIKEKSKYQRNIDEITLQKLELELKNKDLIEKNEKLKEESANAKNDIEPKEKYIENLKFNLDSLKQEYENKKQADTKTIQLIQLEQLENQRFISKLNDIISSNRHKIHELEKNNEQHQKIQEEKKIIIKNLEQTTIQLNEEVSSKCNKIEKMKIDSKEIEIINSNQRKIDQERIDELKLKLDEVKNLELTIQLRNLELQDLNNKLQEKNDLIKENGEQNKRLENENSDFKLQLESKNKKIQELELNLLNERDSNLTLKNELDFQKMIESKIQEMGIYVKKANDIYNSFNTDELASNSSKRSITNQSNSVQDNEELPNKIIKNSSLNGEIENESDEEISLDCYSNVVLTPEIVNNEDEESTSQSHLTKRLRFSYETIKYLNKKYNQNKYLTKDTIEEFREKTSLTKTQIKDWFSNKRRIQRTKSNIT